MPPSVADWIAVGFFAAVAFAAAAIIVRHFRRSPLTPAQTALWWVNYLLTRILWRMTFSGGLDLPPGQGAVIVANHRSSVDPSFIEASLFRVVHWMVAKEYCEGGASGWFLKTCEVIPTSRGGIDTAATKQAMRYVAEGGLVGIFPEGRINDTAATLLPGRPGAVLIALKARAPIVPCFIFGSPYGGTPWSPLLRSARVRVVFGRPIDLSAYFDRDVDRQTLEALTRHMLGEMAKLAGDNGFQPQLAGRFYRPEE